MIRLYGIANSHSSLGRVTAGIRWALTELGLLAGFVPCDLYDDETAYPGYDAKYGVFVGRLDMATWPDTLGRHEKNFVMLAPNSTWLPRELITKLHDFRRVTFVSPSTWGAKVITGYVPQQTGGVTVWNHGVVPDFAPNKEAHESAVRSYEAGRFDVLHMTSTTTQRKGTKELIEAWATCVRAGSLGKQPLLRMVIEGPPPAIPKDVEQAIIVSPQRRMNLSPEQAARFYQAHHVVCQPSRAEGFGLVPLEARAAGVPIVATGTSTGHADHVGWCVLDGTRPPPWSVGFVHVRTGEDAPVDDGPGAEAPSLVAMDVADSLSSAYADWPEIIEGAQELAPIIGAHWSWIETTKRWLKAAELETT